jgi:hypothetical protein
MRIKAKELFKHDIKTYQAGKVYEIELGLGKYFVANGWATEMGTKETPRKSGKEVVIKPDSATVGQRST